MSLPEEPKFLHFQDIVDQARKSIVTYCPEWTDYNLSDPGITLIELFAWMTTQLNYRLNQVPKRNFLKFLELLGATPRPPRPAGTELTFYLSIPFPLTRANGDPDYTVATRIPANTEAATRRSTGSEDEIIFTTQEERLVASPRLIEVRRDLGGRDLDEHFNRNYIVSRRTREGQSYQFDRQGFFPFQEEAPQEGDTFYLGFAEDQDIKGYVLQLETACSERGVGVDEYNPPLVWECSQGEGQPWQALEPDEDTTGGLTRAGRLTFYLPLTMKLASVRGVAAYWLRCRLQRQTGRQAMYTKSPRLDDIKASVMGVTVPALQSAQAPDYELLGESNGEPGQRFYLTQAPLLPLEPERDEFVEVEAEQSDGTLAFVRWQEVKNFARSGRYDPHFTLDTGTGELCFGPGIRQPDGQVRQCGAVPKLGRKIRITRYRTGGGTKGNLPAGRIRVLKNPISYVVEVSNRVPARGGEEPESIEAARLRAQEILQGRQRAVTAEDYEYFCQGFSYVARAKCLEFEPEQAALQPGAVKLLIVPRPLEAGERDRKTEYEARSPAPQDGEADLFTRLKVDDRLKERLRTDLEPYRVLGVTVNICEPVYLGVKVRARVRCKSYSNPETVKEAIIATLKNFMTPVARSRAGDRVEVDEAVPPADYRLNGRYHPDNAAQFERVAGDWAWPFGQNLYISDIYALLKAVAGVEHVTGVKLWRRRLLREAEADAPWEQARQDVILTPADGLIYLLDYEEIEVIGCDPH